MGIDLQRFPWRGADEPKSKSATRLLFVGRLVPQKAPEVLIAVAKQLLVEGVQVKVRIAGDGPMRPLLEKLVEESGLNDSVELLGATPQQSLPALYNWADIFVLPSREEGIPVVLMEAMAAGTPVVTTRVGGIPELVSNGHTGIVVEPDSVSSLCSAIGSLAASSGRRIAMSTASRAVIEADFDCLRESAKLAKLLQRVQNAREQPACCPALPHE